MSDPESSGQANERNEMRERKKEKKRRKAEKRLREALAKDKIASSSSSRPVQETEEEERVRRKKEKKEAKKLRKHKEASAAGQRAASDAPVSTNETTVLMPSRSKSMELDERQTKKNRKRKERTERDEQQEQSASGSQVIASKVAYSTEPFYPIPPPSPKDADHPSPKKAKIDAPAQDSLARSTTEDNEDNMSSTVPAEKTIEKRKKKKDKEREKSRLSERVEAIVEEVEPTSISETANSMARDETMGVEEIENLKSKKGKSTNDVEEELVPSNGVASRETDELKAMQSSTIAHSGESSTSSQVKSTASRPRRPNIQSQIDNIIVKASRSGNGERSANRVGSATSTSRQSGAGPLSTKEGTLEDARGLTHKEMLADRLYHSQQLKWLQEEFDLKIKTGKFSKWERDRIDDAINQFKEEQSLSDEDFIVWLFNTKQEKEEKGLYTQFWKSVTASLEDRPNRAVRIAVRRSLQPDASQGAWSDVELTKLRTAVQANGKNWAAVARKVGSRSAEDCRLRWRDFAPAVEGAKKKGKFTDEDKQNLIAAVRSVCQEADIDPMSPNSNIPWKKVADKIGGERSPAHCLTKWQAMLKKINGSEEGSLKWTLDDSKILVSRLMKEKDALERDDFTEVKLASLRSHDWLMEPARLLEKWKGLVRQYISPTANYKTDFRTNLQMIHKALSLAAGTPATETTNKRRRSSQVKEDLIESYEEV